MAVDGLGRTIDYLRISITDRCNLRCVYCMPEEGVQDRGHTAILSYEQILDFVRVVAAEGVRHIRLTGGEPLVRLGVVDLVRDLKSIPGIESIAMTTNGILLADRAQELRDAGLDRVNISLDTLDREQFVQVTRRDTLDKVLAGIDAALETGFEPVKVNAVAIRSLGQDFLAFARLSVDRPLHVRFIEYMPVGGTQGSLPCPWTIEDAIPSQELRELIDTRAAEAGLPLLEELADGQVEGWGPAHYFRFPGAQGTVGFISAVSNHFCATCNRMRLTADGKLRPCLFSDEEIDILPALQARDPQALRQLFQEALRVKPDGHNARVGTERSMSQIGG